MGEWWDRALSNPWAFITIIVGFGLYKLVRFIGRRLLDEERGIIPKYIAQIQQDSKSMKETISASHIGSVKAMSDLKNELLMGLGRQSDMIEDMNKQLIRALQASPNDEDLFKVLFEESPVPMFFLCEDLKFTKSNLSLEDLWGLSGSQLQDESLSSICGDAVCGGDLSNVRSGKRMRYRFKTKIRDRDARTIHIFRYPLGGSFIHYIGIVE